jgi:hypothetical protein
MGGADKNRHTRREANRLAIYERTRLRPNSWSSLEVQILDVSSDGLRAKCEATLKIRSWLSIEVPGIGPIAAEVRWQRGKQFGASFVRPIDLQLCSWTPSSQEASLAQLLGHRAAAHLDGDLEHEKQLRERIKSSLPIRST